MHWKATHTPAAISTSELRATTVTDNHVKAAIHVIQTKGSASSFQSLLGLLRSCKSDIGDIGHSRYVISNFYIVHFYNQG